MDIKFTRLVFSNVLSFGTNKTQIDFKNGLNLIVGANGSGKSTILDALSFCLFGKPYRNVNIKDIINRINKKNLYVECEFIKNNTDVFRIIRTLKPDSIKIFKNEHELELLSSKKLNQDEIDKIIGINYDLFKQVISLAINYNKPFLTLPTDKKRGIIEQIFNVSIFGKMSKLNKKKISDLKVQIDLNSRSLMLMDNSVLTLKKRFIEIENAKKDFDKDKKENIIGIENKIKEKNDLMNELINEMKNKKDEYVNIKDENDLEYRTERDNIIKDLSRYEYEIKINTKKIDKIKNMSICPECNSEITEEHKNKEINKFNEIIDISNKDIEILTNRLNELDSLISDIYNKMNHKKVLKGEIDSLSFRIDSINSDIENLKIQKQEIEESEFKINVESMRVELLEKYDELKKLRKTDADLRDQFKIYEIVNEIVSDEGIKSYFFKNFIPLLNNKINEYLQLFEIPITLKFDEFMVEKITNYTNLKNDVSYMCYSEGEKKRIDLAILLSFISITKSISDWNCNLLMIDELLDSAIDEFGLEKLVLSLKKMGEETGDMCIYVISHRLKNEYNNMFSNRLTIKKQLNQFSIIT